MGADDVLKRKKPRVQTVTVVLDDSLTDERDKLIAEISRMKRSDSWADSGDMGTVIPALQDDLRKVLAKIEADVIEFKFRPISRNDWNAAVEKYANDEGNLGEDFELFIVANSSFGDNKLSMKQVEKMYSSSDWSAAETEAMFNAAYSVNREARDIPFTPAGIEAILSTGSNSTTAENEE